jgi:hypothetical protein
VAVALPQQPLSHRVRLSSGVKQRSPAPARRSALSRAVSARAAPN